jgi:NADPH:quinone reductase
MKSSIPEIMKAAVIDRFGGPGELHIASIPVPKIGEHDILVRIDTAGIGAWDPWIREGGMGGNRFPLVLGSDGSGTVAARGSKVRRFKIGDRIYSYVFSGSKGGFYAEYAAIPEDQAALIPARLSTKEAGALAASGVTALAGLDKLRIRKGTSLMILGASGGVGHVALQLAKLQGARLLAVASGTDGTELAKRLGADVAVNGRRADAAKAARAFAPDGLDAAMSFAGSEKLQEALKLVKKSGMIAFPNGVEPEPKGAAGVKVRAFDGLPGRDSLERLNGLISRGPFRVEISRTYRLEEAAQAHRDIFKHHIGKLAFRIRG